MGRIAPECMERDGCTGFEYNNIGNEGYKCGTYTGGASNLASGSGVRKGVHANWQTCVAVPCDPKCGCGFEYTYAGTEGYSCGTYTGGNSNLQNLRRGSQH